MRTFRTQLLFIAALFVFLLASTVPAALRQTGMGALFDAHPTLAHFIVKSLLLLFVLIAIALDRRRGWSDYGFQRAQSPVVWRPVVGMGAILGAVATTLILLTPAQGMTFLRQFGLLGLVLSVWFYSSLSEELFVRGWFQSIIDHDAELVIGGRRFKVAVVVSGLLFGSMHLTLFWKGTDALTALIIVSTTTLLGFVAATYRERYQSLIPAFVTHVAFNVGGFIAGMIINIIAMVATGHPVKA